MLTTKEIRDKAERSYKDFLLSVLRREVFFPFHIKGNKGNANLPLQELYPALKHLIDHSKEKIGYGFTLTYKEVNTRHSGIMTMPDEIFFENPQDFLKFIERENDFLAFRKAIDLTKRLAPTLLVWAAENCLKVQKNALIWEDVLKIVLYFSQNPTPNCYWRQLPINVDLAVMETHQPLIGELLDVILPPKAIFSDEKEFAPRFGLCYDEPLIHFRFLDEKERSSFGHYIALPISKCLFLQENQYRKIFFIGDKNVFLSFPNCQNSIAILWDDATRRDVALQRLTLQRLTRRNPQHELYVSNISLGNETLDVALQRLYGVFDISPKSFEQLSEMRNYLPNLQSFLMDKNVFDAFPQHHQTAKKTKFSTFLPQLTPDEQILYQNLLNLEEKNTLLQNDISYSFLEKKVFLL